jgi:hypothetical protein
MSDNPLLSRVQAGYCKDCDLLFYSTEFKERCEHYCAECGSPLTIKASVYVLINPKKLEDMRREYVRKRKSVQNETYRLTRNQTTNS